LAATGSRRKLSGPAPGPPAADTLAGAVERATEAERRRIGREVHDRLGPMLTALHFDMIRLRKRLAGGEPSADLLEEVDAISGFVDLTLDGVRRITTDLRPPLLDDVGLAAAVEWQAADFTRRTGIPALVRRPAGEPALSDDLSAIAFRIFQELLTNVARHAAATCVTVVLDFSGGALCLEVHDDGRGFPAAQPPASTGLRAIRERVSLLSGELTIEAPSGRGAAIKVRIPFDANSAR
jgi:signal transduction histidine kinase